MLEETELTNKISAFKLKGICNTPSKKEFLKPTWRNKIDVMQIMPIMPEIV